ncbi:zf-DNL-domain-containing protein [Dichomitus squalens]|uniref:Zf-DNL-domain-containing protein n=1 Tax=Dichomitus squalens TaxID=114155 RepID=A0A4Q9NEJ4_9APHY|nr:zf-DNL-domain-containing protein [Dichomitus squalens]TBU59478.1 zf-DNL-domain-containing protein [Dichomitus squalens]
MLQNDPSAAASYPVGESSAPSTAGTSGAPASQPQTHITLEQPEPRLALTFTCTVEACGHRSTHQFTKRSYTRGIVIVQCPGCKNRHLIADHLGWFKESTEDGKLKTVEDLLRAKGEKVRRGRLDAGGVVEYAPE